MKRRKTLIGGLALCTAAILALAGCSGNAGGAAKSGGSSKDLSGQTINYWYWQDVTTDTTIQDLAKKFKAETGITVNLMNTVAQPDYFQTLVNGIAAGNGPDATQLDTNMLGKLITSNSLENLNDEIKGWDKAGDITKTLWPYVENADESVKYAVPLKFLMFYMYYRADIFKELGLQVPKTQKEFVDTANKIAAAGNGHYGFDIRGGANGQDQWAAFMVAGGGRFVKDGKVAFNSDATRTANDLYAEAFKSAPPGSINDGLPQVIENLKAGTATMAINHLGSAHSLSDALGDKLGVALIPSATGDPTKTTYMGTMNMTAVLATSQHKEAAFKWISYLGQADAQLAIAKSPNGYLPVVGSVADNAAFKDNKFFQTSIEAAKYGALAWPPLPGTTKASTQTWQPLFQGALLGKNSNDDVVKGVADALAEK